MLEDSIRRLTINTEGINARMEDIIEAFVEFYGINRKSEIDSRLKSVFLFSFYSNESLKENLDDLEIQLFRQVFNLSPSTDLYIDFDRLRDSLNKGILCEDMLFFINNQEDYDTFIEDYNNGKYPKLNEFYKKLDELKTKFKPYYDEYEENIRKGKEVKDELFEKYLKILVDEYQDLFPEDLRNKREFSEEDKKRYDEILSLLFIYRPNQVFRSSCFSERAENILHSHGNIRFKKEIKETRIKIFKLFGFSVPQSINTPTYEDYMKNPEVEKFVEKMISIDSSLQKRKDELNTSIEKKVIESQKCFKDILKLFEGKTFLNSETFDYKVFTMQASYCIPNFIMVNGEIVYMPIVAINKQDLYLDCGIIHELNHIIELILLDKEGKKYMTGWDIVNDDTQMAENGFRKYELVSEYVNERISQDITAILIKNNKSIYSDKKPGKDSCLYMHLDFLLSDFYDTFKDVIIESRSNGNINVLFEKLGEDNFEELVSLVNEFSSKYKLNDKTDKLVEEAIINPDHNDTTMEIHTIIEKKNKIIENMKLHLMDCKRGV